ncbi:MAG: helix-turn-helix domain-containing protein [Oscillospiraceae bacterium]
MDFGTQMKELRKKAGLTQEEAAKKLNVSRQAVSNWENNKNLPDIEVLIEISRVYAVSLDELILGGKEDMNNMTEKLIDDGKETTRMKSAAKIALIGAILMVIGLLCFVLKGMTVEYIDEQGILHENFFFVPIGWAFIFAGLITVIVGAVKAISYSRKKKRNS